MSWVAAVPLMGKVIDKLFPDANKAHEAKAQLAEMMLNGELEELKQQSKVIQTEAIGDSWLQRSWRPMVMLTFTVLVVCRWLGWTAPGLSEEIEIQLLSIVKLGVGGYITSRGVEKVVKEWKN